MIVKSHTDMLPCFFGYTRYAMAQTYPTYPIYPASTFAPQTHCEEVLRKQAEHGPRELQDFLLAEHGQDYASWMEKLESEKKHVSYQDLAALGQCLILKCGGRCHYQ